MIYFLYSLEDTTCSLTSFAITFNPLFLPLYKGHIIMVIFTANVINPIAIFCSTKIPIKSPAIIVRKDSRRMRFSIIMFFHIIALIKILAKLFKKKLPSAIPPLATPSVPLDSSCLITYVCVKRSQTTRSDSSKIFMLIIFLIYHCRFRL